MGTTNIDEGPWVQLATRIPKDLHRQLKLHCVTTEESIMDFIVVAIRERLAKNGRGPRRGRRNGDG